jgi:hypothetical protein
MLLEWLGFCMFFIEPVASGTGVFSEGGLSKNMPIRMIIKPPNPAY